MSKRFITVMLTLLIMGAQVFAQNTVTGKVTDAKGEAIPGASVVVKGTQTGTMTNLDGTYSLSLRPGATLVFSCIGFKNQEIVPGSRAVVNVALVEDSEMLEEVVYVAYGTAKKKDLTGSITAVDGNAIAAQAQGSVTRALEGQVAGLQVSSLDGQPGLDMGIRVRGIGTTTSNNSNALIIIDGVPATDGTNPLASLNSKDIESVTVLKDAASTALYGARGANGVILVTTKSGKSGKAKVSFEGRWGINAIGPNAHFDKIGDGGPGELYEFYWESIYNSAYFGKDSNLGDAYKGNASAAAEFASQHLFNYTGSGTTWGINGLGNHQQYDVPGANYTTTGSGSNQSATMSGAYLVGTDGKLNPNAVLKWTGTPIEEELISNRFRQEYNVSASGGTDAVDYHVSLGYLNDPAYIATSAFDRYTARANVNAKITEWLKVGTRFAYTHRKTNSLATRWGRNPGYVLENPFSRVDVSGVLDIAYAIDQSGKYVTGADGERLAAVTDPTKATVPAANSYSPVGPTVNTWGNYDLMKYYKQQEDSQTFDDLNTSGYLRAKFLKYFTAEVNLAYNVNFGLRMRYWNSETAANRIGASLGSVIKRIRTQYGTFDTQQLLNYDRNIGKHHVDALLGHEFYKYNYEEMLYGSAHSLLNGFKGYANFLGLASAGQFGNNFGGGLNEMAMESYFGRVNYIFDEKYYLSGSLRRDGSSKFKTNDTRWGTFWSVGAGWRISSEPFMEGTKRWLDNLKVRTSYGVIGNQNGIGMYSGYQTWSYSVGSWTGSGINGTNAYAPATVKLTKGGWVNSGLTWEHTRTADAGLDFTMFGGALSGTFDWFNKHTYDAIFKQNVSYLAAGQAQVDQNTAGIRSHGIEIELSWQPIKTKDWDLIFSTNGTHYNTVLTSVPKEALSDALGGCYTANSDGWSLSGEGSSSGNEYLRGIGKDWFNLYLYKYGGVAGNPGVTYYGNDGKAYTGYTKGDPYAGMPLFYHKVTEAEAAARTFGSAAAGTDILSTNNSDKFASRYEVGDAIPEWIGGFTTNVRYKNFDLAVMLSYQIGGKFFAVDYASGESGKYMAGNNLGQPAAVSRELLGNTWSENNPSAKFPMVYYNSPVAASGATLNSWNYTTMSLFDASYLSVKNVTLGYTLPRKITKKANISNLRFYVACDNPVLLFSHSGIDPRWSITGGMNVGAYSYPYLAVYTFGVNLDF